jgi:hypothetical protein
MKFNSGSLVAPKVTKKPVPKVSNSTTLPSPVGGLNARDPISNMDPTDAIVLTNFFPSTLGCQVRKGYGVWAFGLGAPVDTLDTHSLSTGTDRMYAYAGGNMYDVTGAGQVGAPKVTGLSNARWQSVNYPTSGGVYYIAVNGIDPPIVVGPDLAVHRLVAGNGTDAYTVAGANPNTFVGVIIHQRRLWFVILNDTNCAYFPVNVLWGAAAKFDFGPLFKRGGFPMQQIAWTMDAGDGPDDRLCTISSKGEIAVYAGTDPANMATWGLNGVFFIGAPMGRRCATRFGGDVAIICEQGLASMAATIQSTSVNTKNTFFSDKIQNLINTLTGTLGGVFGWEPFVYPGQSTLLLNIPDSAGTYQFAMNTITGAWATFRGMKANTWTLFQLGAYYGASDGTVYHGLYGLLDGVDSFHTVGGTDIACEVIQAFNYFQNPGANKLFQLVRPSFIGANEPAVSLIVNAEFDTTSAPDAGSASSKLGVVWDSAIWDTTTYGWTGGTNTFKKWYSVTCLGYAGSLAMKMRVKDQVIWASTDWSFEIPKGTII